MSALVDYDSSSDEGDEGEASQAGLSAASTVEGPTTLSTAVGRTLPDQSGGNALRNAVPESAAAGPLLGPAAPTNGGMMDADSPEETPNNLSERETIRYLTQASVPMASMPPSPPGATDPAANKRFARFLELKAKGVHFNKDLAGKSTFLNPGLLTTMMARAGIDEEDQYNTSLSTDVWNPKGFPKWAYKEELLKSQQEIRARDTEEKQALSAAGKRTIDFTPSGGTSGDSSRRSTPGYQKKRRRP